mmetsp:Transcript_14607/g.47723  ORF Transcript_14607/g.47723 Transcript_14607/m.47723 type:complete len:223 (-) Transcript_14607:81-749(-)|eukprot:scaffold8214_cov121-Isochrysis_galbana.AAC.21
MDAGLQAIGPNAGLIQGGRRWRRRAARWILVTIGCRAKTGGDARWVCEGRRQRQADVGMLGIQEAQMAPAYGPINSAASAATEGLPDRWIASGHCFVYWVRVCVCIGAPRRTLPRLCSGGAVGPPWDLSPSTFSTLVACSPLLPTHLHRPVSLSPCAVPLALLLCACRASLARSLEHALCCCALSLARSPSVRPPSAARRLGNLGTGTGHCAPPATGHWSHL